jgi:hypothetical protein
LTARTIKTAGNKETGGDVLEIWDFEARLEAVNFRNAAVEGEEGKWAGTTVAEGDSLGSRQSATVKPL